MKFRSAFAVLAMTVAVTACGELPFQKKETPAEPAAPTQPQPPAVSPIDSPIETGGEGTARATAEASTMNTAMFRASGAGWTATAGKDRTVYERSGAKSTAITTRRMSYNRGVEFIGTMNGRVFALNIQAAECKSGDTTTPFTAKLRDGSTRLTGCATATDTMPKAQVTASSAAPKAKTPAKPKAAPKPAASPAPAAVTEPAATTPATTTPATPATTAPSAPVTTTTPAPAAPAAAPTPAATPAPAAATPAPAPAATPAPATTTGVPAPQLILPPTPPAASQ